MSYNPVDTFGQAISLGVISHAHFEVNVEMRENFLEKKRRESGSRCDTMDLLGPCRAKT